MSSNSKSPAGSAGATAWPELPLAAWQPTYQTLHMWTQIVGKIRLQLTPQVNHWWEVPLYVTARGLTTSPIPYGDRVFEITFDFIDHVLLIETSDGQTDGMTLRAQPVADFYREFMGRLHDLDIHAKIWPMPVEVENPIRFDHDLQHASYDAAHAHAWWRILLQADTIFKEFRSRFIGKNSPVHFFWGSFDLAVTRFSGRRAPERPGADRITREAYSHEVISCGVWPGGKGIDGVAFYCYAAPEPPGFRQAQVRPRAAFYSEDLGGFYLMYDEVRAAEAPKQVLLDFLQSTYEAGADLGGWNRTELERPAASSVGA